MDSLRREYRFFEKAMVWFSKKSVIVFTMGKVGTLTVCNSLSNIGYKHVHPHSLRYTKPGIHFIKVQLAPSKKVFYFIKTILKRFKVFFLKLLKPEILIITGIRDPFSRNISAFFEQVHYIGGIRDSDSPMQVEELFNKTCDFQAPLHWFDREILKVTGIDVFEFPFDKEKGVMIIERGKYRMLVYRLDKLSGLEDVFSRFIGDEKFEIITTNASTDGDYASQLKVLKKTYKYPPEIVTEFTTSKYMMHFYSQDEIDRFKYRYGTNDA